METNDNLTEHLTLAVLISDGIEHIKMLHVPGSKFMIMDKEDSFVIGSSYRSTFSYVAISQDQSLWTSEIHSIIYNENTDKLKIYFEKGAKYRFEDIDCLEIKTVGDYINMMFSYLGHYKASYNSSYEHDYSLKSLFFAFQAITYSEDYCIIALDGGAYIVDDCYSYYDYEDIRKLHCIHEPYQDNY